jgi:hypothetical protein
MKKISLLALALSAGLAVFAQDDKPARTPRPMAPMFGLKAGANLASLEVDDENNTTTWNTNSKTSFVGGIFFNIPMAGFAIQPEITYAGFGSKVTGPFVGQAGTANNIYEISQHYVQVPIMFQLKPAGGFFVELGPQVGFLVRAEEKRQNNVEVNVKDQFRTTDFAINGGLGYISRVGLGVSARYVHGLSNVFNHDDAPAGTNDREISNRGVQISLVYAFGANK